MGASLLRVNVQVFAWPSAKLIGDLRRKVGVFLCVAFADSATLRFLLGGWGNSVHLNPIQLGPGIRVYLCYLRAFFRQEKKQRRVETINV